MSDLKPFLLSTALARVHGAVTEAQLMRCGGEVYELRRRALQEFKVSDTSRSLNIRLALAEKLQMAEKIWRERLIKILTQGTT